MPETHPRQMETDTNLVPPPPPEETAKNKQDPNLTISTKLSTDRLICKTPQESPSISVKSLSSEKEGKKDRRYGVFYLAVLQILFGILMVVFGVLVIVHKATLAQVGGGIWGGCLAVATGIAGSVASGGKFCPLKTTPQKVAQTVFLALSLISLAISQLVVVLAASGLSRDINSEEIREIEEEKGPDLSSYERIMCNVALLLVSALECVLAAIASYKTARTLCPCFRNGEEGFKDSNLNTSHQIVSSWLGKQGRNSPGPQIYVVAPPSSLGKGSKLSGGLTPVFAIPPPMIQPQIVGYPLIPAPLGTIPSPIIPPPSRRREMLYWMEQKRRRNRYKMRQREPTPKRSKSRSKSASKERQITEQEVAKTYTGLDRTIAEEFIEICDSKNNSLCSDESCTSSCQSQSNNSNCDAASQDFLVKKI